MNARCTTWTMALAPIAVAILAAGCADLAAFDSFADDAGAFADDMRRREAKLAELAETFPDGDPRRGEALAASSAAGTAAHAADAASREADALVRRARDPGFAGELGETVSAVLPPPYRTPVLMAGALALAVARWIQLRRAAGSIVSSINAAMIEDDAFKQAFKRNANVLRAVQTPSARRLVDRVNRVSGARMIQA